MLLLRLHEALLLRGQWVCCLRLLLPNLPTLVLRFLLLLLALLLLLLLLLHGLRYRLLLLLLCQRLLRRQLWQLRQRLLPLPQAPSHHQTFGQQQLEPRRPPCVRRPATAHRGVAPRTQHILPPVPARLLPPICICILMAPPL